MANKKTLLVILGGTIDARYSPEEGTPHVVPVPPTARESAIPSALEKLGLREQVVVWPLAMKDSKAITTADLHKITRFILREGYENVVEVQGTDTMPDSGRYFKEKLGGLPVRLILAGAMEPLRDKNGAWRPQAGGWNTLQRAVRAASNPHIPYGVYMEMGEGLLDPAQTTKAVETDGHGMVTRSGFIAADGSGKPKVLFATDEISLHTLSGNIAPLPPTHAVFPHADAPSHTSPLPPDPTPNRDKPHDVAPHRPKTPPSGRRGPIGRH